MKFIRFFNILLILLFESITLSYSLISNQKNDIISNNINYPIDCPEGTFLYCQHAFNKAMNISIDLTWQNITQIQVMVNNFMLQNVDNYIVSCGKRKDFYNCLGTKYETCINRYHLMTKVTDPSLMLQAYLYPAFWKGYDFSCNGGFDTAIYSTETFDQSSLHNDIIQCQNQFLSNMQNSITSLCLNTQGYMNCMQNFYINKGNSRMGWFACEKARTQYADDCPDLRCYVTK